MIVHSFRIFLWEIAKHGSPQLPFLLILTLHIPKIALEQYSGILSHCLLHGFELLFLFLNCSTAIAREPSLLYYLTHNWEKDAFMPFPKSTAQTQTAFAEICTKYIDSIFCADNHYAICTSWHYRAAPKYNI